MYIKYKRMIISRRKCAGFAFRINLHNCFEISFKLKQWPNKLIIHFFDFFFNYFRCLKALLSVCRSEKKIALTHNANSIRTLFFNNFVYKIIIFEIYPRIFCQNKCIR